MVPSLALEQPPLFTPVSEVSAPQVAPDLFAFAPLELEDPALMVTASSPEATSSESLAAGTDAMIHFRFAEVLAQLHGDAAVAVSQPSPLGEHLPLLEEYEQICSQEILRCGKVMMIRIWRHMLGQLL